MAVICQPDCARRHPGCHDHCEEYAEKSSARKKQLEEYEAKNMNPCGSSKATIKIERNQPCTNFCASSM